MAARNYVPPPCAAPSPNVAPGREFWMDRDMLQGDDDVNVVSPVAVVPDPALPNLSRILLSAQLYGAYLAAGNSPSVAQALADARALQMIP